jgi:outer membrane protein assembly factor BamB
MAGLAATDRCVIVSDRDALDTQDVFRCLDAQTGEQLWTIRQVGRGQLDFGNAPRATPQISGDLVFLSTAFGQLICARLASGEVVWKKDLYSQFGGPDEHNSWGFTSSALVVDDKLIVNPGGPEASIVALAPETGEVIWKTPGDAAAFGSLIVGTFGGKRQIVGHDKHALCGWDVATGKQLWRLVPPKTGEFNVPTPNAVGDKLFVATENNAARLYGFDDAGVIVPKPVATYADLAPDIHTPVAIGGRLFGVWQGLHCLDLDAADSKSLKPIWKAGDPAFDDYATIIATPDRVLVTSKQGELLLIDARADEYWLISRQQVFQDDPGVYSHPALVGKRLYLRGSDEIVCLDLDLAAK